MKHFKLLTAVFTVSMLAACTFSHEKWSNFDNQSSDLRPQEDQAGLVFYVMMRVQILLLLILK